MDAFKEHWIKSTVKSLFSKESVFTVPNFLSAVRLAMIPAIVWAFRIKRSDAAATVLIVLSAATDVLDGRIARKFGCVSDLGKILDPLADKLTQIAMLLCLMERYRFIRYMIPVFVSKEVIQTLLGYLTVRKYGDVNSAKWFGKVSTAVFFAVMIILFAFPHLPESISNVMLLISMSILLVSLVLYARFFLGLLFQKQSAGK